MDIEDAYDAVKEIVADLDSAVYMYGSEGNSGIVIGKTRQHPQSVGVEIQGAIDESYRMKFLELVNGTEWEFSVDGSPLTESNTSEPVIHREIEPKDAFAADFDKGEKL